MEQRHHYLPLLFWYMALLLYTIEPACNNRKDKSINTFKSLLRWFWKMSIGGNNIFQICTPLSFIRYSERKLVWITGTRYSLKDLVLKMIEFAGQIKRSYWVGDSESGTDCSYPYHFLGPKTTFRLEPEISFPWWIKWFLTEFNNCPIMTQMGTSWWRKKLVIRLCLCWSNSNSQTLPLLKSNS